MCFIRSTLLGFSSAEILVKSNLQSDPVLRCDYVCSFLFGFTVIYWHKVASYHHFMFLNSYIKEFILDIKTLFL